MRLVKREVKILLVYHECIFFLKKFLKNPLLLIFTLFFRLKLIKKILCTINCEIFIIHKLK